MIDARGGTRLLQEALHDLAAERVLRAQELDRDVAAELGVARDMQDAEATLADLATDLVLPDPYPGIERHASRILWERDLVAQAELGHRGLLARRQLREVVLGLGHVAGVAG